MKHTSHSSGGHIQGLLETIQVLSITLILFEDFLCPEKENT